jgi:hypothetical protein
VADHTRESVERLHREELDRIRGQRIPCPSVQSQPEHLALPEGDPNSPVAEEWAIFRREVTRLIEEGGKGRFALIKAGQPITVWDTLHDAAQAGRLLHGEAPCLVQQILPYLRPLSARHLRPCRD